MRYTVNRICEVIVMKISIEKEYKTLAEKKHSYLIEALDLPTGYISKKTIKGNKQYYLQKREGGKVVGSYIRASYVGSVSKGIERRKFISGELAAINTRMSALEQAAKLIDGDLYCLLMVYKMSAGMDSLSKSEKERCASFGSAMNAIEGVPISKDAKREINEWKNGTRTFFSAFESALKRYGFPTED